MKEKLLSLLKILLIVGAIALLIYYFFISEEPVYSRVIKILMILAGCLLAVIRRNAKPSPILYKKFETAYKDIIKGAFTEDKKSYNKLLDAAIYWDRTQFDKAHKVLDDLEKKCTCTRDYTVVYTLKGLCYAREGRNEELITTYEKILRYDMTNSTIWSNLGWIYLKMGKTQEAYDSLSNAIVHDPDNPLSYNNMASYFIKIGHPELAIQYALKAIELNPDLYQPMSAAAIAYKMLGDETNAEEYCRMYGAKGGNAKELRKRLSLI